VYVPRFHRPFFLSCFCFALRRSLHCPKSGCSFKTLQLKRLEAHVDVAQCATLFLRPRLSLIQTLLAMNNHASSSASRTTVAFPPQLRVHLLATIASVTGWSHPR
jgi:hypothetical protein